MSSKTKKIILTSIILVFATIGVILTGYISYPMFQKKTKPLTYEEAKETSKELAEEQEKYEKVKEQLEKNSSSTKKEAEKQNEVKKTKEYEEYEKLPEEEKKNINIIPEKEEIPKEKIDNIIEEQKEEIQEDKKEEPEDEEERLEEIPKSFNLSEKINIKAKKNIGSNGLFWIAAALNTVETNVSLKEGKDYDFSIQHVNYITSNLLYGYRQLDTTGNFSYFKNYLMQSGAILEKEVPINKNYGEEKYSKFIDIKPIVNVTDVVEFPTYNKNYNNYSDEEIVKLRNAIKRHIMKNGSLYATINSMNYKDNNYYTGIDKENYVYANEAINIIGWDDDYSKENFDYNGRIPEHDGAYIAIGSFNSNDYFYVSYEDVFIENNVSGVVSTSIDNKTTLDFDNIQTEELKKQIIKKYYYALIEKDNKKYVSKLLLSNIYNLDITNDKFDFNELKLLSNLTSLSITNANINSIEEIPKKNIENLYYLNLSNNNIKDATPLEDTNISTIILSGNENIKNYGKIKNVIDLEIANSNLNELEQIESNKISVLNISGNNITDINGIEKKYTLNNLNISGNKILDYSPINKLKQNKLSNADEYNQQITLNLSNTGITDLTSINGIEVDSLDLSKNSISNLQNFQISDYTKNINLSENNIESLDGFIIPEGLIYLNVSKNKLKDISNFDSKNINSIDLSNNKEIKGFGSLKVQELMVNDCNISDLQELSKLSNVKYLAINNNSLEDISDLSNIKSLESININNNSKPLSGKLISENITSINIVDTEISDKLELDCSKLSTVTTTDIKFNTDYLKSSYSSIIYYNTELNEELINQNNEDKGIYKTYNNAKFPTVKADIKNNEVILEDTYMNTYKNLNNYIESDKIAISKDRKKLIILDNSINKLDIDYNKTSNEKYFLGKLTIEFTKISSLIDSIRNIFFK